MLKKNNFFKGYFSTSKEFTKNSNKVKKVFKSFVSDLENYKIPLMESHKKDYEFDFTKESIKKFSKYKNIIIVGMGGSILGAKSIYSFFKAKVILGL